MAISRRCSHPAAKPLEDDHAKRMFKLADATAERGLLKQQHFGRAPKAAMIRCCDSVSKMLQIDGGCANTTKFALKF
jgi:hypothetical protein